jgi:hypothetical protein
LGVTILKKGNIGILGIIGILVLVVAASGCTSTSNNTTATNSSSSNGQSNSQSASSSGSPIVKVIASGPWMGQIMDSSGSRSVSGTGSQTFSLAQNPGMVSVSFSKDNTKDATNNGTVIPNTSTLTIQIVDSNGNVVATQSTSADAGNAATSYTF